MTNQRLPTSVRRRLRDVPRDAPLVVVMASIPTALLTVLLFCTYGVDVTWSQCHNATALSVQLDAMFAEYSRDVLPSDGDGIVLNVKLDVKHATIDQEHSTMRLLADLKMTWEDTRLRFNQTEWGCDYAITSAERLWLPDIVLLNAAATGGASEPSDVGMRARLEYNGTITWVMRLDVSAPVELQLYDWPKDSQLCTFKFGSRSYGFEQILLQITDVKNSVVFESGAWNMDAVEGATMIWERDGDSISLAAWTIKLTRRMPAHALAATTVMIASALVLMTAITLPPDQRHALAACASFIAALWLITALLRLPGAHTSPRALTAMCALCACGAACSLAAALVRRLARATLEPPRPLRAVLSSLSAVCRLTPPPEECSSSESGAWAAASVLADRAMCAGLLLTIIVLFAVQLL